MTERKPRSKLDFKKVADRALGNVRGVLDHWLPGGKYQGAEYVVKNPTRSDESAHSFSINTNTGIWSDFATSSDKGGDLVALVAYVEGCSNPDACHTLAGFLGLQERDYVIYLDGPPETAGGKPADSRLTRAKSANNQDWRPVYPVPESALSSRPVKHSKLEKPSQTWEYRDQQGRPLLWVMRFDTGRGKGRKKEYRPLCYGERATGATGWTWKQPPDNRPLYGLEYLGDNPAVPVLLCEGEKATDAARQLFPDAVAMTWLSGSKAIGKADFSPLAGRTVWYWPDNDQAGKESVPALAKALKTAGVNSFSVLDIALLDRLSPGLDGEGAAKLDNGPGDGSGWPEKADAADAEAMGWTAEHFALLQPEGLIQAHSANKKPAATGTPPAVPVPGQGRYKSDETGLYYFDIKSETYRRVGGRLDVLARSRNQEGRSWGLLVSFDDHDGTRKEWNIPSQLFATEGGADIVRGLLDKGYTLLTNREAKKRLLEYLGDYHTTNRVRLVERMGWHGAAAFMLPDRVIGTPAEPLHYYSESPLLCKMAESGTLEQWRDNVAAYCEGNHLLTFAVAAAFTAPLLDVLGSETIGFHFVGDSSLGKSTLLKVAASVYGHPGHYPRTWRATDNALEATASAHSDCLLILDEIGQIEPRIVGETVYMLGNNEGKLRATETGASRGTQHRWRLVFLSSGEKTLLDHMAEANKKPQAGMEMRLLTIPSCPHDNTADRKRLGIYHHDQGFSGGADLSTHLMDQATRYHGTALLPFLELLTGYKREDLVSTVYHQKDRVKKALLTEEASGQVHRTADKFALVAAAGELATMAGITGWPVGEATRAAEYCFNAWLSFRGGTGNLEDKQALDHVRLMLTKYGESRFTRWESEDARIDEHAPRTMERWGFRKTEEHADSMLGGTTETTYVMEREGFKALCEGLDYKRISRLLHEAGALVTDNEPGRLTKKTRIPGGGKKPVNCYVVRLSVLLSDGEPGPEEPESPPPDVDAAAGF